MIPLRLLLLFRQRLIVDGDQHASHCVFGFNVEVGLRSLGRLPSGAKHVLGLGLAGCSRLVCDSFTDEIVGRDLQRLRFLRVKRSVSSQIDRKTEGEFAP